MNSLRLEVDGSGPPLVLVPGFACAPNVWFKVRKPLSQKFQLHLVTVPGFGGTPAIDAPVMPKLIELLSKYCAGLTGAVLVGHSLGGTLALGVAARNPDSINRAIVVDGLPFFATVFDLSATVDSMRERAAQIREEILNSSPSAPSGRTYFDEHIIDPRDAAYMNETTPASDRTAMAEIRYELLTTDLRPEMPNVRAPVLAIGAGQPGIKSNDDVEGVRRWYLDRLATVPNLELAIAEKARHFVMIDDPDWFLEEVIRFSS